MKKEKYSSVEILNGIKNSDNTIIRYVYDSYFDSVKNMVINKGGSEELAYDVFQEALVVIYKKSLQSDFKIDQSSFFTYFYAVCRIKLLSIFNKSSKDVLKQSVEINEGNETSDNFHDEQQLIEEGIKEQLFHKYLNKISKNCLDILKLVMKGLQSEKIAENLKMSSAAYVRKKKRICLKSLIEMIKKDPKSKELL